MEDYNQVIETYKLVFTEAPDDYLCLESKWVCKARIKKAIKAVKDVNRSDAQFIILHKISYYSDKVLKKRTTRVIEEPFIF
jgi:hypothetical protein